MDEFQNRVQNKALLISKINGLIGNQNEQNLSSMRSINETMKNRKDFKEAWKKANYKICCKCLCFCCCCKKKDREYRTLKEQEEQIETYIVNEKN